MTTKRAQKIVATFDQIEDEEPGITEDRLYQQTAHVVHCEREDVSAALIITDNLKDIPMTHYSPADTSEPVYKLLPSPFNRDERLLMTHDPRACALAVAIGGRESKRGEIFFTPGRAEKWRLLYDAGFSPVPGKHSWRYARNGDTRRNLSEAVQACREEAGKPTEILP
jgi:hypothetical protein